jgi:hypothetical protein
MTPIDKDHGISWRSVAGSAAPSACLRGNSGDGFDDATVYETTVLANGFVKQCDHSEPAARRGRLSVPMAD